MWKYKEILRIVPQYQFWPKTWLFCGKRWKENETLVLVV